MRCRYCATISREVTRPFAIASRIAGIVASTTVNTGVFGPWAPAPHATAAMPTADTMSVCFIRRVSYDSHATVRLKADATYVVSAFRRTFPRTWCRASAGLFRVRGVGVQPDFFRVCGVRLQPDYSAYVVSAFSRTIRRTWRPASAGLFRAQRDHRIHARGAAGRDERGDERDDRDDGEDRR